MTLTVEQIEEWRVRLLKCLPVSHANATGIHALCDAALSARENGQALWDIYKTLGFDTDGDPTPDALIYPTLAKLVADAATEARKCYDDTAEHNISLRAAAREMQELALAPRKQTQVPAHMQGIFQESVATDTTRDFPHTTTKDLMQHSIPAGPAAAAPDIKQKAKSFARWLRHWWGSPELHLESNIERMFEQVAALRAAPSLTGHIGTRWEVSADGNTVTLVFDTLANMESYLAALRSKVRELSK